MLYIHGGQFIRGSNSTEFYGGGIFLTEDVVLVTTNYRMGPIGFLGFSDPSIDAPGNNGLKDCVAALKWIQENVKAFGGDPNNVTIFGASAGSVICHFLLLTQSARGLFHKAILQSGVANSSWAVTKSQPWIFARKLGYIGDLDDEKAVYEYLLNIPGNQLMEAQEGLEKEEGYEGGLIPWAPIIEVTGCPTESNFLTKHPYEILLSGDVYHVPVIFGYSTDEGLLAIAADASPILSSIMVTTNYEDFVPFPFRSKLIRNTPESKKIGQLIHNFYYGDKVPSKEVYQSFVNYFTDVVFLYEIIHAAELYAQHSTAPVYIYRFSVDLPYGLMKPVFYKIEFRGCVHGEELAYMFNNKFHKPEFDDSSAGKTVQRFVKLWTNFAKYGNPCKANENSLIDVDWPVFSSTKPSCLLFDLELGVQEVPELKRLKFWNDLCGKYGVSLL